MLQEYQGEIAHLRAALAKAQAAAAAAAAAEAAPMVSEEALARQMRAKLEAELLQQHAASHDEAQVQVCRAVILSAALQSQHMIAVCIN